MTKKKTKKTAHKRRRYLNSNPGGYRDLEVRAEIRANGSTLATVCTAIELRHDFGVHLITLCVAELQRRGLIAAPPQASGEVAAAPVVH